MPFWSCTVFEISPEFERNILDEILFSSGNEYIFGHHDGTPMRLFINERVGNPFGELVEIELDVLSPPMYYRGNPNRRYPVTARLAVQKWTRQGWPAIIGVFGARSNADKLRYALRDLYSTRQEIQILARKHLLNTMVFRLREKEECINSKFPDLKELAVEEVRDFHVDKAVIKGHSLEESPLFEQWVRDDLSGGRVRHFGFHVLGQTVIVNTFGNIYSRQGGDSRPYGAISHIIRALLDCDAIRYQASITQFSE